MFNVTSGGRIGKGNKEKCNSTFAGYGVIKINVSISDFSQGERLNRLEQYGNT